MNYTESHERMFDFKAVKHYISRIEFTEKVGDGDLKFINTINENKQRVEEHFAERLRGFLNP
jgi:hypothetical protein